MWLLSTVSLLVDEKVGLVSEVLVAVGARVRLGLGVGFPVGDQLGRVSKGFVTVWALVRFHPAMNYEMANQKFPHVKSFTTTGADIEFFSGVWFLCDGFVGLFSFGGVFWLWALL